MKKSSRHAEQDRALFDRIAEQYARKDRAPACRIARRRRLQKTLRGLEPDGQFWVECGCGAGFATEYLAELPRRYLGIDYSESLIAFARERHAREGLAFAACSLFDFEPPEPVDVVFMIGVLHHVEDPWEALKAIYRWLKPGGIVAINEPSSGNGFIQWLRRRRAKLDETYSEDQDTFSVKELRNMLKLAGFINERITGQGLLSTPFAEVILPAQNLMTGPARLACGIDRFFERRLPRWTRRVSWNLIARATRPQASQPA